MKNYRISGKRRNSCVARGRGGMVVCADRRAAEIGVDVLQRGGNAFDAAVAVSLALAVTEPTCSGLGGSGFMTAYLAKEKKKIFLDFWAMAPAYIEKVNWKEKQPEQKAAYSVSIPGEAAGLDYINRHFGQLPLSELAAPAVRLAAEGFPVSRLLAFDLNAFHQDFLRLADGDNPYLAKESWKTGDILKNPDLAASIEAFGRLGADALYRSELTDKLIAGVNKWGGQITREDFDRYAARPGEPVHGEYRGYDIYSSNLPSSGGTLVLENLNMLEQFPLSQMPFDSPERLFLLSEVFKKSLTDKRAYIHDPALGPVPQDVLLSKAYGAARAAEIEPGQAKEPVPGRPEEYESSDTTHFSVVDADGNLVAQTQTISNFFGSCILPAGTGIVLNCQLGGLAPENVKAYVRPISTTSPSLIFRDGKPLAVIGSPGANRIVTTVTQLISNLVDGGLSPEEAVFAPRVSNDCDNVLRYEGSFAPETIEKLESWGQKTLSMRPMARFMGGVGAIFLEQDGLLTGVADPRRDGSACCTQQIKPQPKGEEPVLYYRAKRNLARHGDYYRGSCLAAKKEWDEGHTVF